MATIEYDIEQKHEELKEETHNHIRPSNPTKSQTPTIVVRTEKQGNEGAQERLQFLEDRLRAIEVIEKYNFKASDMCLVPNVTDKLILHSSYVHQIKS
ncbi:hypothetical protein CR513_12605, partial [Mucuna pruriens]